MKMLGALILAGLAFTALAAVPAQAHNAGVSTSRITINERSVSVEINALGRDYEKAAGVRFLEAGSGLVNPVALAVMAPAVLTYVGDHVAVLAGNQPCARGVATARPADTHVLVTVAWTCPADGELRYRVTLFQDVDPAARHVAVVAAAHGEREFVLDRDVPQMDLSGAGSSTAQVVGRFVRAGIEHIFLGYDHIAFLVAVILWGRSLWPLVKVVTAFTLAHSLTLSLAVLDIVRLPSSVVEPLIAATIVFVAAENFFVHDIRKRWRATFVLGLVHGFGFAGALREYGLPTDAMAPALAAFNIGVEIGQVTIVALVFPLLLLSDRIGRTNAARKGRNPAVVYACSAAILGFGLYWLIERTVFA
jgi:hydrogenase/urease accessory protein HupE